MADHDSVRYQQQDGIAVITIDDGKRNALPPSVFKGLYKAFRQAEKDRAVVILTGREGVFSAGFDLKVMKAGNTDKGKATADTNVARMSRKNSQTTITANNAPS